MGAGHLSVVSAVSAPFCALLWEVGLKLQTILPKLLWQLVLC
jgi:hypothetical protein